jgi:hypothetical protein
MSACSRTPSGADLSRAQLRSRWAFSAVSGRSSQRHCLSQAVGPVEREQQKKTERGLHRGEHDRVQGAQQGARPSQLRGRQGRSGMWRSPIITELTTASSDSFDQLHVRPLIERNYEHVFGNGKSNGGCFEGALVTSAMVGAAINAVATKLSR